MYAVVTTGGKQYRVEAGSELVVERLAVDAGASITFDRVLLLGDGDAVTVGTPTVAGASVSGTVLGESKGPKLIIFKFKQKATYRRKNGHRQHMTRVRIDEINAPGGKAAKAKPAEASEEKAEKPKASTKPKADATEQAEKPKRTRKPAAEKASAADAKADATEQAEKPKRTRKPAAKKAESEE